MKDVSPPPPIRVKLNTTDNMHCSCAFARVHLLYLLASPSRKEKNAKRLPLFLFYARDQIECLNPGCFQYCFCCTWQIFQNLAFFVSWSLFVSWYLINNESCVQIPHDRIVVESLRVPGPSGRNDFCWLVPGLCQKLNPPTFFWKVCRWVKLSSWPLVGNEGSFIPNIPASKGWGTLIPYG